MSDAKIASLELDLKRKILDEIKGKTLAESKKMFQKSVVLKDYTCILTKYGLYESQHKSRIISEPNLFKDRINKKIKADKIVISILDQLEKKVPKQFKKMSFETTERLKRALAKQVLLELNSSIGDSEELQDPTFASYSNIFSICGLVLENDALNENSLCKRKANFSMSQLANKQALDKLVDNLFTQKKSNLSRYLRTISDSDRIRLKQRLSAIIQSKLIVSKHDLESASYNISDDTLKEINVLIQSAS